MNKEEIQLIKDLIIYLDVMLNSKEEIYINNNFIESAMITSGLAKKHKDFTQPNKRQELIRNIIEKLEALKNESNID